jgi:transcriptional regulator with XRE-family HTH domain
MATHGTYRVVVPAAAPAARLAQFTAFVNRALRQAEARHGWSIPKVAERAGIGVNTIYRWSKGEWGRDWPKGELVEQFCITLDIPTSIPFMILWPGSGTRPVEPAPDPMDPEFERVLRKLRDPNVPDAEKYMIRETIRSLASRPNRPPDTGPRRKAG